MRAMPRRPPDGFGMNATSVARTLEGSTPASQMSPMRAASVAADGMESNRKSAGGPPRSAEGGPLGEVPRDAQDVLRHREIPWILQEGAFAHAQKGLLLGRSLRSVAAPTRAPLLLQAREHTQ